MKKIPKPPLETLIKRGDIQDIKEALHELSPFEIATFISQKSERTRSIVFGALANEMAAQTFEFLPVTEQRSLLLTLPTQQAAYLLKNLRADHRTAFLQELPRNVIDELVKLLPNEERILTLTLLGYPEHSIGRLMRPDYIAVMLDWNVQDALDHIRSFGQGSETINDIYAVDEEGKLLETIRLSEFLFASPTAEVNDLTKEQFVTLSVNDNDDAAVRIFRKFNRGALPVVDDEGIILGIVTIDDVLRLSNIETYKDIQKIGGMESLDAPYMQTSFWELMWKRAGWLIVFFFGSSLTGTVLIYYREEIVKAVILIFFVPVIISIGGNAGSQASALVISSMVTGEIQFRDWWKVLHREILSGLFLGTLLGIISLARITLFSTITEVYGEHWLIFGQVICLAILAVVLWGTIVGAMLPLIYAKLGFNPASASSPFISTIISTSGMVIYFQIALTMIASII
jgi:magnesium transporter